MWGSSSGVKCSGGIVFAASTIQLTLVMKNFIADSLSTVSLTSPKTGKSAYRIRSLLSGYRRT